MMRLPLLTSFSTGVSAIARRPSSKARSFRPSAASIKPKTQSAGPYSGCACTIFSCWARAASNAVCALASSLVMRASSPSPKLRLRLIVDSFQQGLSPSATSARSAAAGSRSASAHWNQTSAAVAMAPGPCARIASIVWWSGRVSAFREDVKFCTIGPRFDVVGHDRYRPIQRSDPVGKAPQALVTERDLLQSIKVARVQLYRALQVLQTFLLLAAPPQNVTGEFEETRIIGQGSPRDLQLGEGAGIVAQAVVEILRARQMSFGSLRSQPCRGLHRCFSQGPPGGSVIRPRLSIKIFVRIGELAVSVEK